MTPNFFQAATLKQIWVGATLKKSQVAPYTIWVDFTGYPLNHFSGCRLDVQSIGQADLAFFDHLPPYIGISMV